VSPCSRRSRVAAAAAILSVSLLVMGCESVTGFETPGNDGYTSVSDTKPEEQAEAPAPFYDTEDAVIVAAGDSSGETAEAPLFDNQNLLAVYNGGTSPTFEVPSASTITKIETYHWNDAAGHGSTGTISLSADDGTVYGPWETAGRPGQGGVPNAYWAAVPNVALPAGSYTVIDSDPGTWSQNADSGGVGFAVVYGQSAQ